MKGSFSASQTELDLTINLKETTAKSFGVKLQNDLGENIIIKFDKKEGKIVVDRTNSRKDKFSDDFFKKFIQLQLVLKMKK